MNTFVTWMRPNEKTTTKAKENERNVAQNTHGIQFTWSQAFINRASKSRTQPVISMINAALELIDCVIILRTSHKKDT